MMTAVSQTVHISGISGLDNNTIMFEFNQNRGEDLSDLVDGIKPTGIAGFNSIVLRSTEHNFGTKRKINLWIMKDDFRNVEMMIFSSDFIMEHRVFTKYPLTTDTLLVPANQDLVII